MMRNDKDPTLGHMTQVDWDDPQISRLLEATETLRLDNRGTHPARAVHLRLGAAGGGVDRRALLLGDSKGNVLRVLFDQALSLGQLVSVQRDTGAAPGAAWDTCSVVACRPGERREDSGRAIFVIELQAQRNHGTFAAHPPA
jgi:hypothetical protein